MFRKPKLKNGNQQEIISKFLGSSEDWNLGLSFDYFIDWSQNPPKLNNVYYIKNCFNNKFNIETDLELLKENNILELEKFNIDCFKDKKLVTLNFNEFQFSEDMLIVCSKLKDNQINTVNITLNNLKSNIIKNTGKKFTIGSKGLIWYTTMLEKGLSTSEACYPGDCDCLMLNDNNEPIGIIEFQKRTNNEQTFLNEYMFENLYYGNQKIKFDRLMILAKEFTDKHIPLYILHYHTSDNVKKIALEEIDLDLKRRKNLIEFNYLDTKEKTLKQIKDYILNQSKI